MAGVLGPDGFPRPRLPQTATCLSEVSAPKTCGLIGGLSGVRLSAGAMTANWVGFAGNYASYDAVRWRLPLALQA
ncbi:hypothetical protein F4777DRAFT_576775 [Nemania sp. FL0916]|nr:hypothetical protein F4777DRAFT_576775 [Nemania sp. FL0916]